MDWNNFFSSSPVSNSDTGREQITYIPIDRILEDEQNFYSLSEIPALADNIATVGLQQPIRVRKHPTEDGKFMIVSGHRRRAALALLAEEDPERWAEIACIIQTETVSPALQQLQLIYANSATRKLSSADMSEQAVQVEKLLYQLQEEGHEFPGRMREHVAKVMQTTNTKLATLKKIREHLAACWQPAYKKGELVESTAYELSKMPEAYQSLLFEEKARTNANLRYLYADYVKTFAERAAAIEQQQCSTFGGDCNNHENKLRKAAVSERYGWFHCDNKCCRDCPELTRCKNACPRLNETIKQLKSDLKNKAKLEAAKQAEADRPVVEKISALWQRFGLARGMAGMEISDCEKAMDLHFFPFDNDVVMKLECGETKIKPETKLPYGYSCSYSEISRLIALADLFGCSLDYLLCRTDAKEIAPVHSATEPDIEETSPEYISGAWYPVSVEPPFGVPLVLIDSGGYADTGKYKGSGEFTMDYGDPVTLWSLYPHDEDVSASSPTVPGWHSGVPGLSGTYAAYVRIGGLSKPMLRELHWNGEWWSMHKERISDDVRVEYWAERPEV